MAGCVLNPAHPANLRRVEAVDVVRGLIIALMALDHVRDFFGDQSVQPTDLAKSC
jgi:uncharacterized membrane protein